MTDYGAQEDKKLRELTLKDKTAKGFFWGGLSNIIQQIIGMLFGIVIARILSPGDYGLVAMLTIFTAIANTLTESGFSSALINRKTVEYKDYNAVFWFSAFTGMGVYIIFFFAAPLIARFYNQ
ncbi:MAG: oligosaccharide flippase family protein, partial [Tannerella sp.]|nr:oligosaccharide flippase family protein [Tannerella sp.]